MPLNYPEGFELSVELHRSSYRRCCKTKGVLNIFAKFTGKHLPRISLVQVFSYEFCKTFKSTYFEEYL